MAFLKTQEKKWHCVSLHINQEFMFWVFNPIVIWYLSAKSGQCVTSLFVVLPIRIFSFSTNVYIFRNFSYRTLRFFFYTSLLRYAWNHGSAQVYIQIPICLCVECLCYLFKNIFLEKQIVCGHSFDVYVKIFFCVPWLSLRCRHTLSLRNLRL